MFLSVCIYVCVCVFTKLMVIIFLSLWVRYGVFPAESTGG